MGGLFFAVIDDKSIGILKKISYQAKSISRLYGFCDVLYFKDGSITCERYVNEERESQRFLVTKKTNGFISKTIEMQKAAYELLKLNEYEIVYFRDQLLTVNMCRMIKYAKVSKIKVYMEIPTYPYYKEQLIIASNKLKALVYIILASISDCFYLNAIDCIPVVVANSKAKLKRKMVPMINGADSEYYGIRYYGKNEEVNIFGVGYLSKYHGFEKVIYSLAKYYKDEGMRKVYFHIAGDGPEKHYLEQLADKLGVKKYVYFEGNLDQKELKKMYEKASISVGTLSLEKRGADIDTSLKVTESLMQGIPVIVSGKVQFEDVCKDMIFHIDQDKRPLDIIDLLDFLDNYSVSGEGLEKVRQRFDWKTVMDDVFR